MKSLSAFPRVGIAHLPTPLEPMPNLEARLGGARMFVKRDDCTGLAMGGNKARKLEFHVGRALSEGATAILTTGAVQSNYARAVAAAAARFGLRCDVQLEDRVASMRSEYHDSGNVRLDRLFGAHIHPFPVGDDEAEADRSLDRLAHRLRSLGHRPYVIRLSIEHPPLGALGYVDAAVELIAQLPGAGLTRPTIVVATGSARTQAGLLVGLRGAGAREIRVVGICVRRPAGEQRARVLRCVRGVEELLACPGLVHEDDVEVDDAYLGGGYGITSPGMWESILLAARTEGILLDPVYTAKAFGGAVDLARGAEAAPGLGIIFLHTGGTPALFAYPPPASDHAGDRAPGGLAPAGPGAPGPVPAAP